MIRILGANVKTLYDGLTLRREGRRGSSNGAHLEINIDPSYPEDALKETLCHEILEMLTYMCDIEMEHQTLSTLSCALFQVLNDNPKIFSIKMPKEDK